MAALQQKRVLAGILFISFIITSGCSKNNTWNNLVQSGRLSAAEAELIQQQPSSSEVQINIIDDHGQLQTKSINAANVPAEIEQLPNTFHTSLDLPLDLVDNQKIDVDEQLLYSGKEEFGISAWRNSHALADGRGVTAAVVDDGIALGRPGLIQTSDGRPKIRAALNTSPLWQLPLRSWPQECGTDPSHAATAVATWSFESGNLPPLSEATQIIPFDVSPCGISKELTRRPGQCASWKDLIPNSVNRVFNGVVVVDSAYVKYPENEYVLIDWNGDGKIQDSEILVPLSADGAKTMRFADGRVLAFDIHNTNEILAPSAASDNPIRSCLNADLSVADKTLTLIAPHGADDYGTHGEGVASILAGNQIGGRSFGGVAPGAQLFDVHFGDGYGGRRYTISEIGRALKIGGLKADVVNLSYSLFFHSAASQAAMGRFLNAYLADSNALYFFSAGNNGPGRGSMNRALLYPQFGMIVGAFLTESMAQTVFGSSMPIGGVVTYSSRGPSADGYSGPMILSPLAGMASSTVDQSVGPFSGTSSATPAMSGFAALLISQIRAEGLQYQRMLLKRAIIESAQPLAGVAFVDQGYGIPKLSAAYEKYKQLISANAPGTPELNIRGNRLASGIESKGIYVRNTQDRQDQYSFEVEPRFLTSHTPEYRANYVENLKLVPSANWIKAAPYFLIGRTARNFFVAIDWDALATLPKGEFLGDVKIYNADNNELRGVIPVTVILPEAADEKFNLNVSLPAGGLNRIYLTKPSWAHYLLASVKAVDESRNICGAVKWYNPSGVKNGGVGFASGSTAKQDVTLLADSAVGVYELDLEARGNHTICPANQNLQVQLRWIGVTVRRTDFIANLNGSTTSEVEVLNEGQSIFTGSIQFSSPVVPVDLVYTPSDTAFEWINRTAISTTGYVGFGLTSALRGGDTLASSNYGYPQWTAVFEDNRENIQGFNVPLDQEGIAGLRGLPPGITSLERSYLNLFDLGPQQEGIHPARMILLSALLVPQNAGSLQFPPAQRITAAVQSPARVRMALGGATANYPALAAHCQLKVDGFESTVPCGVVQFK